MKNVLLFLLVAGIGFVSAQTISFEQAEGFSPGDINGQNDNWTSTPNGDNFIPYQEIVDDMSSDGSQAFKNAYIMEYGQQDSYILGAVYTPSTPIPWETGFTVSYDFYGTAQDLSDFTFQLVDFTNESYITFLDFSFDGFVKMTGSDGDGGGQFHPSTGEWTVNTWHNLRMEYQDDSLMHLFLDDAEVSTGLPYLAGGAANVEAIRLYNDNWGGDGYYDNIVINGESVSVTDVSANNNVSAVFPNPVKDQVNIRLAEDFDAAKTTVSITNMTGKQVADFASVDQVNVAKLPAGVYVMTITDGNKTETKRLIKK